MTDYDKRMMQYGMILMKEEGKSYREIAEYFGIPILRVRSAIDPDYIRDCRERGRQQSADRAWRAMQKAKYTPKKEEPKQQPADLSTTKYEYGVSASGIPFRREWLSVANARLNWDLSRSKNEMMFSRQVPLSLPRISILEKHA